MKRYAILALAFLPLVAAAAPARWGPTWSEVTGILASQVQMHMMMAVIKRVDGKYQTDRIVKMEPGKRTIVVQSPTRKGMSGSEETLELDVQPCKRYYLNAQFASGVGPDWKPVLARVEAIAGCKLPAAPK